MYIISAVRFEFFQKEFEKLVKFAKKCNSAIPSYTAELVNDEKRGYVYHVEVSDVAPKYDGWEFVARIDNIENIITGVKDFPGRFYEDHGKCEHCNVKHNRVKTYIIQKDSEFMEVGGSCIKKYTGGLSPDKIARQFDILKVLEDLNYDEEMRGGKRDFHNMIHSFISVVKSLKDRYGYTKASDEHESTSTFAYRIMTGGLSKEERESIGRETFLKWRYDNVDYAEKAIEYVKSIDKNSDYITNLKQILENGFFTFRSYKILGGIVQVYDGHLQLEQNRKTESLTSDFISEIGNKVEVTASVTRKRVTCGMYGMQTWLLMKDDTGNVITWSASKDLEDLYEGDTIKISGKVKDHKTYNEIKQTVLTRCKFQKI